MQCHKPCAAHAICCETCQIAPLASSEQIVAKLRAAARKIAEEKSGSKRLRGSGRLASLHDISADIQRASTIHPRIKRRSAFETQPDQEAYAADVTDPNATEFYPCFGSMGEPEHDLWANATDPFLVRSRPTAAEAAHIEAADIQRVQLEEHTTLRYPTIQPVRRRFSLWRLIFGSVIILALSALLIDGLLLSFAFYARQRTLPAQDRATHEVASILPPATNANPLNPAISAPLLDASPLRLNFSAIQAQANPRGQVFTMINNSSSLLKWQSTMLTPSNTWLTVTPTNGSVPPNSTGQVTVNVSTAHLAPGTYIGRIVLNGRTTRNIPTADSPQILTVSLLVQSPCNLAPLSARSLLFNSSHLTPQTITLMAAGSCTWPLHWSTNVSPIAPWLTLTPAYGALGAPSQERIITARVDPSGLALGLYSTLVKISVIDATGKPVPGTLQTFAVILTVQLACTLQLLPTSLNFSVTQGTPSASQTLAINLTDSCVGGVAWLASTDSGSSAWLSLSATSGLATNKGSTLVVTVTPGNLPPHTYTGQITVSASHNGIALPGGPQTLDVTLLLTG
jgi:BACON domain-containing protein